MHKGFCRIFWTKKHDSYEFNVTLT